MGISETTVKIHRHQVMEKMAAGSLAELVRMRMGQCGTGVLGYWGVGCWGVGVLRNWGTAELGYWSTEVLGCRKRS
jgi:hypothetical protein